MRTYLLAVLVLLCPLLLVSAPLSHSDGIGDAYQLSPRLNWKQIETPHFRITFPAELAQTAERAANYLEDAHAVLSKALLWQASYKVPILLVDNTDSANGITSPLGRFGIILFATPPEDWFSTSYYDNWLRLLCFHEYTHFLNMDATRGFWATGRYLFGDVLLPNAAWPNWMLEGLAVYMETRYTHSGRGRSSYYEMLLRAATEAHALDTTRFYTLDRLSLSVPYYPAGEAVYMFGYELMNELAQDNGQATLGEMSYRSSMRFPWFINGNLQNITGRDWYSYWDSFIGKARMRAENQLKTIRSQPVSRLHYLTQDGYSVMGSAFSPDGKWLAYLEETLDQRRALYLRDLATGQDRIIAHPVAGAQIAFTPDSKFVVLSSMRRNSAYTDYSDLEAYSIDADSLNWLTDGQRAKDPAISPDGHRAIFSKTDGPETCLAYAELTTEAGKLKLGKIHELHVTRPYDVASQPKFSPDGRTVYYSLHQNGRFSEELVALDLRSGRSKVLVENGHFNRSPAVDARGDLYFVSDLSGVDNLYRYREGKNPELYSNLTTGAAFPSISSNGQVYGAILSFRTPSSRLGWNLAQIEALPRKVNEGSVAIAPAPSPESDKDSDTRPAKHAYPVKEYSAFPSIWPRAWIPYGYVAPSNLSFGEAVLGFDSLDRHRYFLDVGYDTLSSSLDWTTEYQNRSFGPTFTLLAENQFSYAFYIGNSVDYYVRDQIYSLGTSFENYFWNNWTPYVALTFDKTSYFNQNASAPFFKTQYLPDVDGVLSLDNTARSRLAIGPEEGRTFLIGGRYYLNNGDQTTAFKGVAADTENFRIGSSHAVLSPSFKASYTTYNHPLTNPNLNSDVIVQGYYPLIYQDSLMMGVNGYPSTSLSRLPIRGYPFAAFYEKAAVIPAVDFRFPLFNVFRGWGTNPVFLDQIYGTAFVEAAYFPFHESQILPVLPSAGGGLTANLEMLVQIPVAVSLQYQYGFQQAASGTGDMIVDLGYSGAFF